MRERETNIRDINSSSCLILLDDCYWQIVVIVVNAIKMMGGGVGVYMVSEYMVENIWTGGKSRKLTCIYPKFHHAQVYRWLDQCMSRDHCYHQLLGDVVVDDDGDDLMWDVDYIHYYYCYYMDYQL